MPMLSSRLTHPRVLALIAGLGLLASACGGDTTADSGAAAPDSPATGPETASIADRAAANQKNLTSSDDVRDIQVLAVDDGAISSLRKAVAGDRPVLLWFWAPH